MSGVAPSPERAWQGLLDQLKRELPRPTFDAWLAPARPLSYQDGVFTVGVPSEYARAWMESRLASTLSRGLAGGLNAPVEVRFAVRPPEGAPAAVGEDPATPEGAWATAVAHLLATRPGEAAPLREARFLAHYHGRTIAALPTEAARAQVSGHLEARLAGLLRELLGDPAVELELVVAPGAPDAAEAEDASPEIAPQPRGLSEAEAEILVRPICTSLREVITRPRSVVIVSAYLLRWLPYLGVDRGWFLLAMRQAFYQAHGEKVQAENCGQTFTVSRRQISRWSSLGDKKVWRYLKRLETGQAPGEFLGWFLQGQPCEPGRPRTYTFRADMPLTPGDAEALDGWLRAHGVQERPLEALQLALAHQPGEILPHPAPPPARHHHDLPPDPKTVPEVALAAAGLPRGDPRYLPVKRLADDLREHLQSPSDNLLLTHYFLLEWVRKMGRVAAWIVTVLRDRGFIDHTRGIRRDRVRLEGGYGELSQMLALSERQVESWLPPLKEMVRRSAPEGRKPRSHWARHQAKRRLVGRFLEKEGEVDWSGNGDTRYVFRVRLEEPLTPPHQALYDALEEMLHEGLVAGDLSLVERLAAALDQELVRDSHNAKKAWSAKDTAATRPDPRSTQHEEGAVREAHTPRSAKDTAETPADARTADLKAQLVKHLNPKILKSLQHLLHQHLEEFSAQAEIPLEVSQEGEGEGVGLSWNWEKLLGYSGAPEGTRAELLRFSELRQQFLGQLLYGYEHRASGQGGGIRAPFQYALSRRGDRPPPEYMELAGLPPEELAAAIGGGFRQGRGESLSPAAFRVARALQDSGILLVIQDAARAAD
jgi:hypothetical protein